MTGSFESIDVNADKSSKLSSEVNGDISSAQIQQKVSKRTGREFILQMDNDAKHISKAT